MFALQLSFHRHQLFLHYKSQDAAEKAFAVLNGSGLDDTEPATFSDHFGRRVSIRRDALVSVLLIDMKRNSECNVEMQVAQAEENAAIQSRVNASPKVRSLNMSGVGGVASGHLGGSFGRG